MKRTHFISKNITLTLILLITLSAGFLFSKSTASAAVQPWMEYADTIPLNSSISSRASNNVPPTGMDPWWSYEDYFYFYLPSKQQVTITVSVNGTEPFEGVYLLNSNGGRLKEIWKGSWTYSRNTRTSTVSFTTTLPAGSYYIKQWDIFSGNESVYYTTRVSAQTIKQPAVTKVTVNKANISRIKKSSKTSAKITWKKVKGVSGYEIYRNTSRYGTYKKIKTVSAKTTSFKNKSLKRKRTYYYMIRSYKKVKGKTYYSSFSSIKSIKM